MWSRSRSPTRFGSTRCPSCWLNSNPPPPRGVCLDTVRLSFGNAGLRLREGQQGQHVRVPLGPYGIGTEHSQHGRRSTMCPSCWLNSNPPPSPGSLPRGELILEPSGGFVPTPLACRRLVGTKFPSGLSTWSPLRVGGLEPLVGPWTSQARG